MNWRQKLAQNAFRWSERVLYIDRNVIVMDKPPGLITQLDRTTPITDGGNLSKLLDDLKQSLGLPNPPYRVHRLDKGTTGCFLLTPSKAIARELSRQFQRRTIDKTYLALVRGGSQSFPQKSGQIRTSRFSDDSEWVASTKDFQGAQKPELESKTDWELVASSPHLPLSLLRLKLLTGHKHQLRTHLSQILNAPILGESQYSQTQPTEEIRDAFNVPADRIFLHASQISFFRYRPSGGHKRFKLRVIAPLPPDFVTICEKAGIAMGDEERLGGLFKSDSGKEKDYQPVVGGEIPDINGSWIPQHN